MRIHLHIKNIIIQRLGSELKLRFARGAVYIGLSSVFSRGITLILSFFLARILGKEGFGAYGLILSTITITSSFIGMGLGSTATRYIAGLKEKEPVHLGKILGLTNLITVIIALGLGLLIISFPKWIAGNILHVPGLAEVLQISAVTIVLGALNSIQNATLTGFESFRSVFITTSLNSIFQSVIVLILAIFYQVEGAIVGLVISSAFGFIIYYIWTYKVLKDAKIKLTFDYSGKEWKIFNQYSLPSFLSSFLVGPIVWISYTFLSDQPNGIGELGIFTAAMQWDSLIQFAPLLITTAIFPILTDIYCRGDFMKSIRVLNKMMGLTLLIVLPLAVTIALSSQYLIKIYGSSFQGGQMVINIIVISTVFYTISNILGTYLAVSGRMWVAFTINGIWGLTYLVFSYYFVTYGAIGLASARALSYCIHFILSMTIYFSIWRKIKLRGNQQSMGTVQTDNI